MCIRTHFISIRKAMLSKHKTHDFYENWRWPSHVKTLIKLVREATTLIKETYDCKEKWIEFDT